MISRWSLVQSGLDRPSGLFHMFYLRPGWWLSVDFRSAFSLLGDKLYVILCRCFIQTELKATSIYFLAVGDLLQKRLSIIIGLVRVSQWTFTVLYINSYLHQRWHEYFGFQGRAKQLFCLIKNKSWNIGFQSQSVCVRGLNWIISQTTIPEVMSSKIVVVGKQCQCYTTTSFLFSFFLSYRAMVCTKRGRWG